MSGIFPGIFFNKVEKDSSLVYFLQSVLFNTRKIYYMHPGYTYNNISFSTGHFSSHLSLNLFRHHIYYILESGVKKMSKKSSK